MNKLEHTPGPWRAYCRHMSYKGGIWPEDDFLQWQVDGPVEPSGRGDFNQADALLVAAAPDLLEALREVVAFWDSITDEDCVNDKHVKARAAIAKATTAPEVAWSPYDNDD